jgi:hypothetical protein
VVAVVVAVAQAAERTERCGNEQVTTGHYGSWGKSPFKFSGLQNAPYCTMPCTTCTLKPHPHQGLSHSGSGLLAQQRTTLLPQQQTSSQLAHFLLSVLLSKFNVHLE